MGGAKVKPAYPDEAEKGNITWWGVRKGVPQKAEVFSGRGKDEKQKKKGAGSRRRRAG